MPATGRRRPRRLSDADLVKLLPLPEGADSVELKLTVPESEQRSTLQTLGLDPLDAQIRQVYFFDTPDLALDAHGVVVRARRVQRRGDDSVVKLRPVVPSELPAKLRASRDLVVEVDAMPGGYVCSASLRGALGTTDVKEVAGGGRPVSKLFSKQQRAFFDAHAPEGIGLDDLSVLGPINVFKLKSPPGPYGRRLVVELWLYPDYSRILELSTKVAPAETFQAVAQGRAFLAEKGLDLTGEQQTKTKTALRYYTRGG
jgi:hypothetical protein